jgi:hypothetical protein
MASGGVQSREEPFPARTPGRAPGKKKSRPEGRLFTSYREITSSLQRRVRQAQQQEQQAQQQEQQLQEQERQLQAWQEREQQLREQEQQLQEPGQEQRLLLFFRKRSEKLPTGRRAGVSVSFIFPLTK